MSKHPSFMIPGSKKAGTTWLYDVLKQHPDVWMTPKKEMLVNFFFDPNQVNKYRAIYHEQFKAGTLIDPNEVANDKDLLGFFNHYFANTSINLEWYLTCLSGFSGGKVSGDIDPNLYILPEFRVQDIAKMFPDLKVILVVRHPLKRAWSHIKMVLTDKFGDQSNALSLEDLAKIVSEKNVLTQSYYTAILPAWKAAFGDRLLLYSYDRICNEPEWAIAKTLDFIGLESLPISAPPSNVGVSWSMPEALIDAAPAFYKEQLEFICNYLPDETFDR